MKQYELTVGEDYLDGENVMLTSLVHNPATHKLFAVFSEDGKAEGSKQSFNILPTRPNQQMVSPTDNKFERIISGVWFMPDTDYPRRRVLENGEVDLFTSSMTKDQLMLAVKNFVQSGRMNDFDIMHNGERIEGLRTIEVWMLYNHAQLSPVLLNSIEELGYTVDEIPLGTVFMTVFIENEQFFNDMILSGKVKGFSIEGLFNIELKEEEVIMEEELNSKSAQMFIALGLHQEHGTLITQEGNLNITKDEITFKDETITEGSFKLSNKFSIEVREGKIVDFGFEEAAQVVVDSTTVDVVAEPVVEVEPVTEVAEEVVVEDTPEVVVKDTVVDTTTEEIIETEVTEVADVLNVNAEALATMAAEIEALKAQLQAETTAKEDALKALPIPRVRVSSTVDRSGDSNYRAVKSGGKTHYVPKL